jgi:hypothetical protein
MQESVYLKPIDENSGSHRPQKQQNPPDPSRPKTPLPQHAEQEGPRDAVEGFGDIYLEEERGLLLSMQRLCRLLDKQEVVLDTSPLNKGRLILVDQLRHPRRKPARHDIGEQASKTVDEANRPEVREVDSSGLLGEKRDERVVQALETLIPAKPDPAQRQDHVGLDHRPIATENSQEKPSGPGDLLAGIKRKSGQTSSSENCTSNPARSTGCSPMAPRSKSNSRGRGVPRRPR